MMVKHSSEPGPDPGNAVLNRFEEHARRYGDTTAVVNAQRRLTYAQLQGRVHDLTWRIATGETGGGNFVAALLSSELDLCVAALGTLKMGRCFVPLNPAFPEARLASILFSLERGMLLVDEQTAALARRSAPPQVNLVRIDEIDKRFGEVVTVPAYDPLALSWMIFTSGSTGRPKGVMQTYRFSNHFVRRAIGSLRLQQDDRLAGGASLVSHAGLIMDLATLSGGATLLLMEPRKRASTELAHWLVEEDVTILGTVPTLFRRLADDLPAFGGLPSLRMLRLGGETVTHRDVELYRRSCPPHCILSIGYGTSECGGISQGYYSQETEFAEGRVPVGLPTEEIVLQLIDQTGRIVATDQPGEIIVTGEYMSPGYWNRPNLTQTVFTRLPNGRTQYKTGDLGILREDGLLEHLGRKDSQVQIAGQRVEVGEIEKALAAILFVKEAAVKSFTDAGGQLYLAAYVVADDGTNTTQIRDALAKTLPDYMIPARLIPMERLPMSGHGKVDRQALPGPGSVAFESSPPFVAPRDLTEEIVAKIWAEVLKVDEVSVEQHFLELGGDSLKALQIVNRANFVFQIELTLRELFNVHTVDGMARLIDERFGAGT